MGMDVSKFEAIKNKARKMIAEDAKKDSAIIKARQADRNNPAFYRDQPTDAYSQVTSFNNSSTQQITESYDDDNDNALFSAMDKKMGAYMENRQAPQMNYQMQATTQINKGLPKEILESFSNNYIGQSVFDPNRSVLDKMGITGDNVQPIQENYAPQQQASVGKVDYELIKSIVESSVKKYVNALGKKMLTENNELAMVQVGAKKINIVTKAGDLYEADLKFVKNIKK